MLTVADIAAAAKTSKRTVYRMFALGLPFYDLPGGIKVEEEDWEAFKKGHRICQSGRIERTATTLPSNEKESEFIESARKRRRGGMRKGKNLTSSTVSTLPSPARS